MEFIHFIRFKLLIKKDMDVVLESAVKQHTALENACTSMGVNIKHHTKYIDHRGSDDIGRYICVKVDGVMSAKFYYEKF